MDRQFAKQLTKQRTLVLSINERTLFMAFIGAWHLAGNQEEDLLKTNVNKGNTKARLFFWEHKYGTKNPADFFR